MNATRFCPPRQRMRHQIQILAKNRNGVSAQKSPSHFAQLWLHRLYSFIFAKRNASFPPLATTMGDWWQWRQFFFLFRSAAYFSSFSICAKNILIWVMQLSAIVNWNVLWRDEEREKKAENEICRLTQQLFLRKFVIFRMKIPLEAIHLCYQDFFMLANGTVKWKKEEKKIDRNRNWIIGCYQ